jgi:starvation-inducible outer membrane lipoprotein
MRYLILAFAVLLTGCVTAPVVMKFPEVPEALMQKCEELEKVPANTTQLSTTAEIVIKNYGKYHVCRIKVEEWQEWYNANKKIYESVK